MIESLTGCRQVESGESDEDDEEEGDPYLLPITHEVSFEGALKPSCTQAHNQLATVIGTDHVLFSRQNRITKRCTTVRGNLLWSSPVQRSACAL